jgi:CRISPR-associated protein Cas1
MKKLLNTLYIMTQGTYLKKDGETVAVKTEGKVKLRIPVHNLGSIVCFGNVMYSPYLLGHCMRNMVSISHLTKQGRFLARIHGPVCGNVLVRREQYRLADDLNSSARISKNIISGKITNCRTVLQRLLRDHGERIDRKKIEVASSRLLYLLQQLSKEDNLDRIRGIEGNSAKEYFGVFNELIISQKEDFTFHERSRRPPLDRVNALLSYCYTIVLHDMISALESVGLDPSVGFLHRDRPGRPGLALDMMEELRPFIADRVILSLINLKQVNKEDFIISPSGAVIMKDKAKKTLLEAYQKRKKEEIEHRFINEKIQVGLLFFVQALLMNRFIRKEIDGYPPYIWR